MLIERVRIYFPNGPRDFFVGDHYGDEEILEFTYDEELNRLEIWTEVDKDHKRKIKIQGFHIEVFSAPFEKE